MQLIEKGLALSKALETKSLEYHPKSNAYEAIAYEAFGINNRVNDMINGNTEARNDTRYKNIEWGANLQKYSPILAEAVREFYHEYYGE